MTRARISLPVNLGIRGNNGIAGVVCALVLLGSALILFLAAALESDRAPFMAATAALSIYLFIEVWLFLRRGGTAYLVAPPFLATFLYFYISHILPALARLQFPNIDDRWLSIDPLYWERMPQEILWTLLAAICMWRGYYWSEGLSKIAAVEAKRAQWLRKNLNPSVKFAVIGQSLFVVSTLFAASVGMLGIAGSAETRAARIEIYQLLAFGVGLGTISYMLLVIAYFRNRQKGVAAAGLLLLCLISLALQLMVGLLSGFKQQLVIPFAVGCFAFYIVYRRISWTMILSGVIALAVSYMVVEPYRAYLGREALYGRAGMTDMVQAVQESHRQRDELMMNRGDSRSTLQQVAERLDLNALSAVGISYVDTGQLSEADQAWMREAVLMAPVNAVIPRAVWKEKASYSTGNWYNNNVLLQWEDRVTSVGMGPVTYLYMVGGGLGIVAGFFFIGLLQGVVFRGLAVSSAGGMLIYLAGANFLVILPSDVGSGLAGFIQLTILAVLGQFVMLRPDSILKRSATH